MRTPSWPPVMWVSFIRNSVRQPALSLHSAQPHPPPTPELIRCVARRCAVSLALCYDELAAIVSTRRRRRHQRPAQTDERAAPPLVANVQFVAWLCDLCTEDFQDHFIALDLPAAAAERVGIPLALRYCVNRPDDNASCSEDVTRISVNVAGGVLAQLHDQQSAESATATAATATSSIVVLTSLFHLMRALYAHRSAGDLEPINAVLGCAIIVPRCIDDAADDGAAAADDAADAADAADPSAVTLNVRDDFGTTRAPLVVDMLAYTVNWMRETISAFVGQDVPMIREKVRLRVAAVVRLECLIRAQLVHGPVLGYRLPVCRFGESDRTADAMAATGTTTTATATAAKAPAAARGRKAASKTRGPNQTTTTTTTAEPDENNDTADMTVLTALRSNANASCANAATSPGGRRSDADRRTVYGPREVYRPLDPSVMLLLAEEVVPALRLSAEQQRIGAFGLVELE